MNQNEKTFKTELRRVFLFEKLPEPLKPASRHLQIFDNYIENTRLRIRSVRSPETKEWTFILQQQTAASEDLTEWKIAEIYLNDAEHQAFERFEGRKVKLNERVVSNEIRKNRYFAEIGGREIEFDVYLGDLWGLNIARVVFETEDELKNYEFPPFAVLEITGNKFFIGENLVGKNLSDAQAKLRSVSKTGNE